jgi:hypothetical protein
MSEMKDFQEKVFDRVLARRAKRLGVSENTARDVGSQKLFYLAAAQGAAARLGKSPEAVLQDDLLRVQNSSYPTPECLTPDDLEELVDYLGEKQISLDEAMASENVAFSKVANSPWSDAMKHLLGCDPCRTLLAACLPSEPRRREFERYLDKTFRRAIART